MVFGQLDEFEWSRGSRCSAGGIYLLANNWRKNWILVRDIRLGKTDFDDHRPSPDRLRVESRRTSPNMRHPDAPHQQLVRWKRHSRFWFPKVSWKCEACPARGRDSSPPILLLMNVIYSLNIPELSFPLCNNYQV